MVFNALHIIFIFLIIILLVLVVVLYSHLKNKNKTEEKRMNSVTSKFENDKTYLEKEIKRLEYIIENYKQKNTNGINHTEKSLVPKTNLPETDEQISLISSPTIVDDEEFREKNKKLWELSIAVHKEKERINNLRAEIEHRHSEVTKSINYARRIQRALVPSSHVLDLNFTDSFIMWKPKDIVSGDFYWLKQIEDHTVIVVADCTGHGVPGAFMSLLGISYLNEIFSSSKLIDSFEVLEKLRQMIKHALHQELRDRTKATDGIDLALCIINNKTLEMDFSGANNPLFLLRNNKMSVFNPNRNPIGIHPIETPFVNHKFQLNVNDKLYMFSDGYYDQFGGDVGRKFLKKNFQRLLLHMSELNINMTEEKEVLEEAFQHWKGDKHPQIDDILVVGIKI